MSFLERVFSEGIAGNIPENEKDFIADPRLIVAKLAKHAPFSSTLNARTSSSSVRRKFPIQFHKAVTSVVNEGRHLQSQADNSNQISNPNFDPSTTGYGGFKLIKKIGPTSYVVQKHSTGRQFHIKVGLQRSCDCPECLMKDSSNYNNSASSKINSTLDKFKIEQNKNSATRTSVQTPGAHNTSTTSELFSPITQRSVNKNKQLHLSSVKKICGAVLYVLIKILRIPPESPLLFQECWSEKEIENVISGAQQSRDTILNQNFKQPLHRQNMEVGNAFIYNDDYDDLYGYNEFGPEDRKSMGQLYKLNEPNAKEMLWSKRRIKSQFDADNGSITASLGTKRSRSGRMFESLDNMSLPPEKAKIYTRFRGEKEKAKDELYPDEESIYKREITKRKTKLLLQSGSILTKHTSSVIDDDDDKSNFSKSTINTFNHFGKKNSSYEFFDDMTVLSEATPAISNSSNNNKSVDFEDHSVVIDDGVTYPFFTTGGRKVIAQGNILPPGMNIRHPSLLYAKNFAHLIKEFLYVWEGTHDAVGKDALATKIRSLWIFHGTFKTWARNTYDRNCRRATR